MEISLEKLKELLVDAYKQGWGGSLELFQEVANEIADQYCSEQPKEPEQPKERQIFFDSSASLSWTTVGGVPQQGVDPADRSTWTIHVDLGQ